ncbi:transcriptional repressor, LexA family [Alkaliphilus metalliredigens QYMF]|uniref:Transcriptional repressor, LexA family n=1 Tax=Alkaliphilus metalliredigens (strain QYMF) TaxID=293826 RepID=A6TLM1_ALKMQ|nr:LexA family transcriptional regulator [Alkaliphilus metalliredigens]ABR47089.1 transcriptional repressor, LexA family [Alkaliphilus metalliredigens QYMF]
MQEKKDRKLAVLLAIDEFNHKRGYSPTVREIAKLVGVKSSSTVQKYLMDMEVWGMIERQRTLPRALVITDKGKEIIKAYEIVSGKSPGVKTVMSLA